FFFQAEDGIRDRNVTGVQTCALPISWIAGPADSAGIRADRACGAKRKYGFVPLESDSGRRHETDDGGHQVGDGFANFLRGTTARSEERRVGKESRSRGARAHLKGKEL